MRNFVKFVGTLGFFVSILGLLFFEKFGPRWLLSASQLGTSIALWNAAKIDELEERLKGVMCDED